jgi:hypothetical protein
MHLCPGLALQVGQAETSACFRSRLFQTDGMLSRFINVLEVFAAKNQHQDNQNKDEQAFHVFDCIGSRLK